MLAPEVLDTIKQYVSVQAAIEDFKDRLKKLKIGVDAAIDTYGEANSSGTITLEVNDEPSGIRSAVRQARRYTALNTDESERILREKGLYEQVVDTIEVISEQKLQEAYANDLLTDEDLEKMFTTTINYATIIKR